MNSVVPPAAVERLQDSRRAFTRNRLCSAAREMFFSNGYAETSMDQIAQAAGTKRSTLYNHFQDKNEILQQIAAQYGESLSSIIAQLAGPVPSRNEISKWLKDVAIFTAQERTPTILLLHLGNGVEVPETVSSLGERLAQAFAARLPAFRNAVEPGPRQGLASARARMVMRQIGLACLHHIREPDSALAENTMVVAAEVFERFLQDESKP